jgi:hypothetical protein
MSTTNKSLSSFTNFIGASLISGILSGLVGAIVLGTALGGGGGTGLLWGIVLIYLGAGLIGLSIMGAFLRQTARVIVEGLGGNISEGEDVNASRPENVLTAGQYDDWINAGQPDLTTWNGETASFQEWLAGRK